MEPLWISHRGLCERATENTREAFEAAVQVGFKALETDLRLSKDECIILSHDPDLNRLAGIQKKIADQTYDELRLVRLKNGERLYFLCELLDSFLDQEWTFDIKPPYAARTLEILSQMIEGKKLNNWIQSKVRFVVWTKSDEIKLKELFPRSKLYESEPRCRRAGLAIMFGLPWLGNIRKGRYYGLPSRFWGKDFFTSKVASVYHQRGAKILAFLPKTAREAEEAIRAGFDEILTDHRPDLKFSTKGQS
jgi:glycerophosphoryl diester phosphodiesterase